MPKDLPAAAPAWPKAVAAYCAGTGGLGSWARAVATVTARNTSNAARYLNFKIAFFLIIRSKLHSGALTPARNRGGGDLPNFTSQNNTPAAELVPPRRGYCRVQKVRENQRIAEFSATAVLCIAS